MRFFIIFVIPFYLFGFENPYKALSFDEKFNVVFNYFLNEELKLQLPQKPEMKKIEELGEIEKNDYERYYNYIQRVKFLNEQHAEEKRKALEVFQGEAGYYNGKIANLKNHFLKEGNLDHIIQNGVNKTFKVFYGNPFIKDPTLYQGKIKVTFLNQTFYGYDYKFNEDVLIDIPQTDQENFFNKYKGAKVKGVFKKENEYLVLNGIEIDFEDKIYKGVFLDNINFKVKLDIKINNDIFQPIIAGEKK